VGLQCDRHGDHCDAVIVVGEGIVCDLHFRCELGARKVWLYFSTVWFQSHGL
jgi:hypothetical protein